MFTISISFDHAISYLKSDNTSYYKIFLQFEKAGFSVSPKPLDQQFGLQSRFIYFGKEYIEFGRVIDNSTFQQAKRNLGSMMNASDWFFNKDAERVISLNFVSSDIQKFRDDLVSRGFQLPDIVSLSPKGMEQQPNWLYQMFGEIFTPGLFTSGLTYLKRRKNDGPELNISKNSTYAIHESIFVSSNPQKRAEAWKSFFCPNNSIQHNDAFSYFMLGSHKFTWMNNHNFEEFFAIPWEPDRNSNSEYALTSIYANDLSLCQNLIDKAELKYKIITLGKEKGLLVLKPAFHGYSFLITEKSINEYTQERSSTTGEMLRVI